MVDVEMSPDLGLAKIYLSLILSEDKDATLEKIKDHKSEIRKHLGNRIGKQVRIVPELAFYLDNTLEQASRIENLLSGLDIPPADEDDQEKDD